MPGFNRIAIIGNGGGGKTTLAKRLSANLKLPLTHVDSIQFLPNWMRRPIEETRNILEEKTNAEKWVIDGFGPMDVIESRFNKADTIIFVDFPLWRHYWWATKRCIRGYFQNRSELAEGCTEKGVSSMYRLFTIMWYVHNNIRPQLIEMMSKPKVKPQVIIVKNYKNWEELFNRQTNLK